MKKSKLSLVVLAAFVIGFASNNFAFSDGANKIAVVDVQQVVSSSAQVKALKKEQETKAKELQTFIEKARKDVASTTDVKKKQSLEEKYNKELKTKQEAIGKNYTEKLSAIDKSISGQITNYAKLQGYDIVLAKGVVLYGGTDITEAISKVVK
ncbi:OmpH family outer membrane protein [bacterium]|nr:OmpH family outer membrane protein [bacterium]